MNKKILLYLSILLLNNPLLSMKHNIFNIIKEIKNPVKKHFTKAIIIDDLIHNYPVKLEILNPCQHNVYDIKNTIDQGKLHLGKILTTITSLDMPFNEENNTYEKSMNKLTKYILNSDTFSEENLYTYAIPLCGQIFCASLKGLDKCITKGVEHLENNFSYHDLITYVGQNYFNISKEADITDDAYYIDIKKNIIKPTPKELIYYTAITYIYNDQIKELKKELTKSSKNNDI